MKLALRPLIRIAIALAVYVVGVLAVVILSGIESHPDDAIPYYAMFGVLYGAVLGWWWLLLAPALHLYGYVPTKWSLDYGVTWFEALRVTTGDDLRWVAAGTAGIAIGVLFHRAGAWAYLGKRLREWWETPQRASGENDA